MGKDNATKSDAEKPLMSFRAPREMQDRWKRLAEDRDTPVSALIREAMNEKCRLDDKATHANSWMLGETKDPAARVAFMEMKFQGLMLHAAFVAKGCSPIVRALHPDESGRLADIYETVINVLAGLLPWSTLPGQFREPFEPTSAQAERTVRDLSGREVHRSHAFVNAILCMDGANADTRVAQERRETLFTEMGGVEVKAAYGKATAPEGSSVLEWSFGDGTDAFSWPWKLKGTLNWEAVPCP